MNDYGSNGYLSLCGELGIKKLSIKKLSMKQQATSLTQLMSDLSQTIWRKRLNLEQVVESMLPTQQGLLFLVIDPTVRHLVLSL